MESADAVKSDEISVDVRDIIESPEACSDDPLSIFAPESGTTDAESADIAGPYTEATQPREPSAPFVITKSNVVGARTAELVHHLKRALGALDIARELETSVNSRLAALQ